MTATFLRGFLLIALALLTTSEGHAQGVWQAAAGATYVLPVQAGISGGCTNVYRIGVLQRVGRQIAGPRLAVEANLRSHLLATSKNFCVFEPSIFPPPDGTRIEDDRAGRYLTSRFFAGDLRLRATLPVSPVAPTLSLGHGRHWQESGFNGLSGTRPYWVAGVGLLLGTGPRWRLGIEGEYQMLRDSWLRRQVTWAGGQQTANESLGTFHEWLRASGITLSAVVTF
jgi:hypothetical protein